MKDFYTINYVAFLEDIESIVRYLDSHRLLDYSGDLIKNFPGKLIDVQLPQLVRPEVDTLNIGQVMERDTCFHPAVKSKRNRLEMNEILLRIKRYVLENQIRPKDFFENFDTFRCGYITKSQFIRGVDAIGVFGLRRLYLAPQEVEDLTVYFADPGDQSRISWRKFVCEIVKVFVDKDIEKMPYKIVEIPPIELQELQKADKDESKFCSMNWWETCQMAIFKVKNTIAKRSLDIEPMFKKFDRYSETFSKKCKINFKYHTLQAQQWSCQPSTNASSFVRNWKCSHK